MGNWIDQEKLGTSWLEILKELLKVLRWVD
jgi:hypothetical protein